MSLLSVIVPCLNEEAAIPFFYEEMKKVEESISLLMTDQRIRPWMSSDL